VSIPEPAECDGHCLIRCFVAATGKSKDEVGSAIRETTYKLINDPDPHQYFQNRVAARLNVVNYRTGKGSHDTERMKLVNIRPILLSLIVAYKENVLAYRDEIGEVVIVEMKNPNSMNHYLQFICKVTDGQRCWSYKVVSKNIHLRNEYSAIKLIIIIK